MEASTLERPALAAADGEATGAVRARVLMGGRWQDIQYDAHKSLPELVEDALLDDHAPPQLRILWGWGSGAQDGTLTLRAVEGIVDTPAIEAGERRGR